MSFPSGPIEPVNNIAKSQTSQAAQSSAQAAVVQEESSESFQTFIDQFAVNTMQIIRRDGETLQKRIEKKVRSEHAEKTEDEEEVPLEVEESQEITGYYENKSTEVKNKPLQNLKEQISKFDTEEDILQKVMDMYPDPIDAEAAFEFLLQTMPDDLKEKIYNAKTRFEKRFERALKAGKNIFDELREMYNKLTGDPKPALELFEELLTKFTFEKMKQAIKFWLSALGADLNSKGSSIEPGELSNLLKDAKSLQAILGLYSYFASKQRELILNLARKNAIATPQMNFRNLAKMFAMFLKEMYPSPDKVIFMKNELGITSNLHAQEAVFSIMCGAVKGVSPKLFRNQKHIDDVLRCFIDALEAIDQILGE
jgi:type III secretion protein W